MMIYSRKVMGFDKTHAAFAAFTMKNRGFN